mgnify:CR=1 FL=1
MADIKQMRVNGEVYDIKDEVARNFSPYGWRHIRTVTIPEDASTDTSGVSFLERTGSGSTDYIFAFDTDENGEPFALDELFVRYNAGTTHTAAALKLHPSSVPTTQNTSSVEMNSGLGKSGNKVYGWSLVLNLGGNLISVGAWNNGSGTANLQTFRDRTGVNKQKGFLSAIGFSMSNNLGNYGFAPGSQFEIWGR